MTKEATHVKRGREPLERNVENKVIENHTKKNTRHKYGNIKNYIKKKEQKKSNHANNNEKRSITNIKSERSKYTQKNNAL